MKKIEIPFLWFIIAVITIAKFYTAYKLPLFEDEAIYWAWSKTLDPSYSLTTLLGIKLASFLPGIQSELFVRLPALLNNLFIILFLYKTGKLLQVDIRKTLYFIIIFFSIPFITLYTTFISPDSYLLLFAVISLYFGIKVIKTNNTSDWILLGFTSGLMILSKYQGAILTVALFGAIFFLKLRDRNSLESGESFKGNFILLKSSMLFTIAPLLYWNLIHKPVWLNHYLFTEADRLNTGFAERILTFAASQAVILMPFGLALAAYIIYRVIKSKAYADSKVVKFLTFTVLISGTFFIITSLAGKIKGNWSFIIYLPLLLIALKMKFNKIAGIFAIFAFLLNLFLLTILNLGINDVKALSKSPVLKDINGSFKYYWPESKVRTDADKSWAERLIRMKARSQLFTKINSSIRESNLEYDFIASDNFNLCGISNYYIKNTGKTYVLNDPRFRYINSAEFNGSLRNRNAIVIRYENSDIPLHDLGFNHIEKIDAFTYTMDGSVVEAIELYYCGGFNPK